MYGKHLGSCVLTGQNVAEDGILSNGDSVIVTVDVTSLSVQTAPKREEINGANSTRENEVILAEGDTLDIEVLRVNDGTVADKLRALCRAYDYILVEWVEGTGASQNACAFYGVRGPNTSSFRGRGASMGTLSLGPCDIGGPQLIIT